MYSEYDDQSPLPNASRGRVVRDMLVFQLKLFADGIKDLLLSPLSLIAGLTGIFLGRSNPGIPLYELLRFGKRIEHWIDLFAAAYVEPSESQPSPSANPPKEGQSNPMTSTQDFDSLVDVMQSVLFDPKARARLSDRSKSQLDAIAKKLRGE